MNRQTLGFCHHWYKSLGVDDDKNRPEGRIPTHLDNSSETDIQDDTRTVVVGYAVGLVQRLTIERMRDRIEGPRQRGTQGGGAPPGIHTHNDDVVVVIVVVVGWLWRDNQGYRPTSRADP